MSGAFLRKFQQFFKRDPSNTNTDISTQSPLPVSGPVLTKADIWAAESDIGNFTGANNSVDDFFDNLHTVLSDTTSNNPKEITIYFNRSVIIYAIGLGAHTGNFSNIEIQFITSGGATFTAYDGSAISTKKTSFTNIFTQIAGANAIKLRFHTADTVSLSNVFIVGVTATVSRIQGVDPDNNVVSVGATPDGNLKVSNVNQFWRPIALRMNQVVQSGLTLASDTVIDSRTITMSPGHGLVANDYIIILEENGEPQFFFSQIISVVGDVLTLDTIVPYVFTAANATITQYDPDLNKNGSVTVYKAEIRNPFSFPIDITRFIIHITDASAMDDGTFGGLPALTNGISLRKNIPGSGNVHYWNAKTNGKIAELSFDKAYDAKAPAGVYGFSARLTYAGQDKHGVAIRLFTGEAVELLIQDDLTGLDSFSITVEGHFTE